MRSRPILPTILPAILPALLGLSGILAAQNTLLTREGGTLGQSLTWTIRAPKAWFFLPSTTNGPLPLAVLDPADPRVLEVGLDLITIALAGPATNGTQLTLPLPNDANFAGLQLRGQFFTFPGSPRFVDELSNLVSSRLGIAGTWQSLGKVLGSARALPTVTELADRRVLLAGGGTGSLLSGAGLDTTEIYVRDLQRFIVGPRMTAPRALHQAVPLSDGRVLLIGGVDAVGKALKSCELFDPQQNRFVPTGAMATARGLHSAALLPNGRVLVTGGISDFSDAIKAIASIQKSSEIYDPASGSWSNGPDMRKHRAAHRSIRVAGGRVLQVGGLSYGFLNLPGTTDECELYDQPSNTFLNTGKLPYSAAYTELFPLQPLGGSSDDAIAIAGLSSGVNVLAATPLDRAAIYRGQTGTWESIGKLPSARVVPALAVAGGQLYVIGGAAGTVDKPVPLTSCARLDLTAKSFTATAPLSLGIAGAAAISLPEGQLVIAGGGGGASNAALDTALLWFAP